MSYKIQIKHSHATHTGGTKYYALVFVDIDDVKNGDRYSRLYRIYGSLEKKSLTWKCDVDSSTAGIANTAVEEFNKLVKSKSKGGYTNLDAVMTYEMESFNEVLKFADQHVVTPSPLNKGLFECLGATENENFIDYLEGINNGLPIVGERNEEAIKAEQEALALVAQQRQEYYGDMLGSW